MAGQSSDTARILVEQMAAAQGWPEPRLLEVILEQGAAAVPPLLEVVRREVYDGPDVSTLCLAGLLLGDLGATSAIPDLIDLFYRYDDDLLEEVYRALALLGAEAVEPALAVVRDTSLGWYPRVMASNAAVEAAGQDPALRAHVATALRELLADYVTRAGPLEEDEIDMATSLVMDLAHLADLEARDLIDAAFAADIVAQWVIEPQDVARYYRQGGRTSPPDSRAWLKRYRREYQGHRTRERRRQREARRPQPRPSSGRRKLGRNEPCWYGSGKKYKRCHLDQDLGRVP